MGRLTGTTVTEAVINQVAQDVHSTALEKGFWEAPHPFIGELNTKLNLVTTEITEATGVLRDGSYIDSPVNPYSQMTEAQLEDFIEEIADAIIRCFDLASYFMGVGPSIGDVILHKMQFNTNRPRRHGRRF